MKVEMELEKKEFTREDGQKIQYYVLKKTLADKSILEIPVKSDKAKLMVLSLSIERNQR